MTAIVRVGHSSHGAGFAPVSMAQEAGYFAERGVEVIAEEHPSTGVALQKMVDGGLDVAGTSGMAILRAALGGAQPLVVMSIEAENVFAIIGSKDIDSSEDLRGKVVGANGEGDQDYLMMTRALRDWGLEPGKDVEVKFLGSRGKSWEAIRRGEIAAMASTIPLPILARKEGLPVLRDFADERGPYQLGSFVTTRPFADANPDTLRGFLAGMLDGYKLFQSDFAVALPHMKARSKLDDEDVLRETWEIFVKAMDHYAPTEEALAAVLEDMVAFTGQPVDLDVSDIVDPTYLP